MPPGSEGLIRGALIGIAVAFLAAPPVAAAIDYTSQYRAVLATVGQGGVTGLDDLKENFALGPWSETAFNSFVVLDEDLMVIGSAIASADQTSDLANQLVTMSGNLSAIGSTCCAGVSRSDLSIEFTLTTSSPYFSMLSTTGDTATSIALTTSGGPVPFETNGSGILAAGDYGLTVMFNAEGAGGTAQSGSYLFSLTIVPEPMSFCLLLVGTFLAVPGRHNYGGGPHFSIDAEVCEARGIFGN